MTTDTPTTNGMKENEWSSQRGALDPISRGELKRARPNEPSPPREPTPVSEDATLKPVVIHVVVTEADIRALHAAGGPEAVAERLTEAIERDGLRSVLRRLSSHAEA